MSDINEVVDVVIDVVDLEEPKAQVKRRSSKKRSDVWAHFDDFKDKNGADKSRCIYCGTEYFTPTNNGTSSCKGHLERCDLYKAILTGGQTHIAFEDVDDEQKMIAWKFNQKLTRDALARMIVIDELPFKFVEGKGFPHYSSVSQPLFKIPCRTSITKDVYQIYLDEKRKVHDTLKNNESRICLTTDGWTSAQKINYMCLTAHFISNEWKLTKKVLNFSLLTSHRGVEIGKAIETHLLEWGIDNVLTVSVDNASSNDVAIDYLKKIFSNWDKCILKGKWSHIRCVAHVLNLVVQVGIGYVSHSVNNIRGAVKWVRQSSSRIANFKKYAEMDKCGSTKHLRLDVPTRWNSTYLMLETALPYERAFNRYEGEDVQLKNDLQKVGLNVPTSLDWENARKLSQFLKHFFDVTKKVSGTHYVTSHTLIDDIASILALLKDCISDANDDGLSKMAKIMKEKFEKYFGDIKKTNMLLYVVSVLDPRNKLVYLKALHDDLYGTVEGGKIMKVVEDSLEELYNEYVRIHDPSSNSESSSSSSLLGKRSRPNDTMRKPTVRNKLRDKLKQEISGTMDSKSELEKFLKESIEEDSDNFDILLWWKVNSPRFPILSIMARDMLAIPVSTVASEAVFSTSGRILDPFRSSLTSNIVESLICTQDWLHATASTKQSVEEDWEEIQQIDEELRKCTLGS